MNSKQFLTSAILFFLTHSVFAAGEPDSSLSAFQVFAPSRTTSQLWIVDAKPEGNALTLSLSQKVDLGNPGATIAAHPEKPLLYISATSSEDGDALGATVELDHAGNYLRHVSIALDRGYSYLSLDRANRFLLGANYRGGQIDVYALDESGIPGKRVAGLDEGRVHAHCVLPSPDNRFVYIPYVKETNGLYQYRFDPDTGALRPLDPKNANPPEGTGPRHLVYHPKLPLLYFSNEQHLGLSVYEKETAGTLKLRQICDAVGEDQPKDGVSSSDLAMTPDSRFIFAGIRGHQRDFDWISRFRVLEDGRVEFLGLTPADKIPWGLALSPDGHFLLVSAFEGATLTAYRIGEDGNLAKEARFAWDEKISDLVAR